MSVIGFIDGFILIVSIVFLLKSKRVPGALLYVVYLSTLPFIIIDFKVLIVVLALHLIFPLIIFLKSDIDRVHSVLSKVFRSKQFKLAVCVLLISVLAYVEFFNGVETYHNKSSFFQIKQKIGMGHIFPYRIVRYLENESKATYQNTIFQWNRLYLYLYQGELYYYPSKFDQWIPHLSNEGGSLDAYWQKWGEKYTYNPV